MTSREHGETSLDLAPGHSPADEREITGRPHGERRRRITVSRAMWTGLLLVPVVVAGQYVRFSGALLFIGSVLALIPLAWLIGEATDQAADRTGPVGAALLNASFGNAPELIITLFAVGRGLDDVVRGSLIGSVAGNLLLVLGTALLAERGGSRRGGLPRGEVLRSAALVAAACATFTLTTVVGPRRMAPLPTLIAAAFLIAGYGLATLRSLRAPSSLGHAADDADPGDADPESADPAPAADAGARWSLRRALLVLGCATIATVAMSETLTATIEPFVRSAGVPDLFAAGVVVALAGNAAEHGGALVVAARGHIALAGGIAMASATQVGLAVLPTVAVTSLFFNPLALTFRPVELLCLAATAVIPAVVLRDGRTSRRRGAGLCTAYAGVVVAFLLAG